MNTLKPLLLLIVMLCIVTVIYGQPSNNNCSAASVIAIPGGGFGLGTFLSSTDDMSAATIESGETFAPSVFNNGLKNKSLWYKFSLPTTRSVRVSLEQPGTAIGQSDVGFAVYKTSACLPSNADISTEFTPIPKFGSTYHPCVGSGDYLVQVSANNNANGPVKIKITVSDSSGALYDHPQFAYSFGTLLPKADSVKYFAECQSVEDAGETCSSFSPQLYDKTTWHTFTTPSFFDYLVIAVSHKLPTKKVIGYRLYQGNVSVTPYTSLTSIGDCDSIISDTAKVGYKLYKCGQLLPNTTYSLQLFFEKTFKSEIMVTIDVHGTSPSRAPQPVTGIPPSNKLGILPPATTNINDFLSCNSRHNQHPCGDALPGPGVAFGSTNYNLSTFYTFTINHTARVEFFAAASCGPELLLRIYNQGITANCASLQNNQLVGSGLFDITLACLPPGNYTMQISGQDSNYAPDSFKTCQLSNLGSAITGYVTVTNVRPLNIFSLNAAGAYNQVNNLLPLQDMIQYASLPDTFGCATTVRPGTYLCDSANIDKAIYREFNIADSGLISIINLTLPFNKLYKGNANTLAVSQNAFAYPDTIAGLIPYSSCLGFSNTCTNSKVCVVPGTYTLAGLGTQQSIGLSDQPDFIFNKKIETQHNSPAAAQDLGSLYDTANLYHNNTIISDDDYFSCRDNAIDINGYTPCAINGKPATKAIYRQFYLSKPSAVEVSGYYYTPDCGVVSGGVLTLFTGKATNGIAGLTPVGGKWDCFVKVGDDSCKFLTPGWYTIVSYGAGPTFSNPLQNVNQYGYASWAGVKDRITITIKPPCDSPKYNRPYRAAIDTITHQPFDITWFPHAGHTAAHPLTGSVYDLPVEHFNCTVDTPFCHPLTVCDTNLNRVAYYVFKTVQESYIFINTKGFYAELFNKDVRQDSALFGSITPVQPCIQNGGFIQICKLQPGIYTLVLFAGDNNNCDTVSPNILIDQVGYSRFDFAKKAYDFGVVPPDGAFHYGKAGDINPLDANRTPGNDFIYCTTGSGINDPIDTVCAMEYNANIYQPGVNTCMFTGNSYHGFFPRRNLWYTFVVNDGGYVQVVVKNNAGFQNRFSVYSSDVDPLLPFSTVVANGLVDSTLAQGLEYIGSNSIVSNCFDSKDTFLFFRNPCRAAPKRYYILAEGLANAQADVGIWIDSVHVAVPKFDYYSLASDIGNLGSGTYMGQADNYTCATPDSSDPYFDPLIDTCRPKTLWYKFTSVVTGHINFSLTENGMPGKNGAELYRQIVPGDSSLTGLAFITTDSACISPGVYYLMLTGCQKSTEDVYPVIHITEDAGDFCSNPVAAVINNAGNYTARAIIDCHTIGTDYGEFGTLLTCPINGMTQKYKTTWFRIDISGTDTLDVTTYLTHTTNVSQSDIQYRLMVGNCAAMQEGSCVQDSRTQDTYKCLANGSYFIQVFTPVLSAGNNPVKGSIDLHLIAVHHSDTCRPVSGCLANSSFVPAFDCNTDTGVIFNNNSTYGTAINYQWDFGYSGQMSTTVSPVFTYPALPISATYNARLIVTNTACGRSDTSTAPVTVPGRPSVHLPADTLLCTAGPLHLDAASWPGSVYLWQDGSGNSSYNVVTPGQHVSLVRVTYNGCSVIDSVVVDINPVEPVKSIIPICSGDSMLLQSKRGYGETYHWSTSDTTSFIKVKNPGIYYNDITYRTCVSRDSFIVSAPLYPFSNKDSTICLKQPFLLNASVPGGTAYLWSNGATTSSIAITNPGLYFVDISVGSASCTIRDSIIVHASTPVISNLTATICAGKTYTTTWGSTVSVAGIYSDTVFYANGCDSFITRLSLTVKPVSSSIKNAHICQAQLPYTWQGNSYNASGVYIDTLVNSAGCDSISKLILTVDTASSSRTITNVCSNNLPYHWNGLDYTANGTYTATLANVAGCDSIATLVLFVRQTSVSTTAVTLCASQLPYTWNGTSYNASGVYDKTLVNTAGCDSFAILQLTVIPTRTSSITKVICADQAPFSWNGNQYYASGIYYDTLQASTGCDSIATLILIVNGVPAIPFITSNSPVCLDQTLTLSAYSANATGYQWTIPGGQHVATQNLVINNITFAQAGIYLITASGKGCTSAPANTNAAVITAPVVNAGSDIQVHEGDTAMLMATASGINLSYQWTPGLYFITADTVLRPQVYGVRDISYTLTATESGKCAASDVVIVKVLPRIKPIFIPGAFSPNNDGTNDTWIIKQLAPYPEATVNVYTRYGQNVFSSSGGYKNSWDGTYKGKPVPTGTYYYIITTNKNNKPLSGWLMILR